MENLPPLEPIPSPPHSVWREVRVKALPSIAFLGIAAIVVALWVHYVSAPSVQAEAEALRANVISTQPGTVLDVKVKRFDLVKAGDTVARLTVLDSDQSKADLAVILADLKVLQARMAQDQTRNDLNYVQLRLSLVTAQMELAIAKASLQYNESEYLRIGKLFEDKIATEFERDVARRDVEERRAEVVQKAKLVAATDESIKHYSLDDPARAAAILQDPINQAIAANEEKFRVLQTPVALKAPMDGMVSVVAKSSGEKVIVGEPIATIVSTTTERIVGYIRLPINTEPKEGQRVKLITRGVNRRVAMSEITAVGGDIEMFATVLRTRGLGAAQERGLPFAVRLPKELKVRPGELVDVIFVSK